MSVSRVKTWSAGEVLTAVDLNAEFDNLNQTNVAWPLTNSVSAAGYTISNAVLGTLKQLNENVVCIDNYASLPAAIASIGSTVTTLLINKNSNVTTDCTVPSTMTLWFVGQGKLTVSAATTATIEGPIISEPRQIFAGSGLVTGMKEAYAEWWGSNTTPGTTDMTAATNAALTALGSNSTLLLKATTYLWTSTVTVSNDRVHIKGAGPYATKIAFTPTAGDTALEITAGASVIDQGSVSDLCFFSGDSTYTKVAISLSDSSGYRLENIVIGGTVVVGGAQYWSGGAGSIGINVKGREFGQVKNIYCYADRPLLISDNPNSTIDIDHFHFQDLYLVSNTTYKVVEIADGVNLSNVEFDGANPWVLGTYAFYWSDTTTSIASNHLRIRGVRTEQGTDATAYSIYISHNYVLQNLHLEDIKLDTARKGIYLRKVQNTLCQLVEYGGTLEAFNFVGITAQLLTFQNCFFQVNSTATLTNFYLYDSMPDAVASKPIPNTATYIFGEAFQTSQRRRLPVIATASLPAAAADMDGSAIIEDGGAGDRNLILYAGGQRFRIDGGANV